MMSRIGRWLDTQLEAEIPTEAIYAALIGMLLVLYWHLLVTEELVKRTALIVRDLRHAALASVTAPQHKGGEGSK